MIKDLKNQDIPIDVLFKIISRYQDIYINYILRNTNLNRSNVHLLMKLLYEDNICQDELCEPLKLDKGSVTRTLRKLEDEKCITRTQDEENRRRNIISLTEKGKQLAIEIRESSIERQKQILKNIPITTNELYNILESIITAAIEFNDENIKQEDNWEVK